MSRYKGGRAELPTVVGFRPMRTCSISNIVCLSFCSSLEKGQLYIFRVGSDQVSSIIVIHVKLGPVPLIMKVSLLLLASSPA